VSGALCIAQPWPGMARTIYGDHQRFVDDYFKAYPGKESIKERKFALQCKHMESLQQRFVIFLYWPDLGSLGLCVMCCKRALMALDSVDLSSCQKGMYFLEIFNAKILKSKYLFFGAICVLLGNRHTGWESTVYITESHCCCHRLCYVLPFLKCSQVVSGE